MAHSCKTKAVFGPIPSRRLGRSLGIDLLPFKTCSIDCVYCECGATTNLTLERREYYPTEKVPQEIDAILSTGVKADYATFSGVGEPTLHTGLGRIIEHLRTNWKGVKTCLLTNSTFLGDPQLQKELEHLDLIVPSIDGSCEEEFQKINRPCPGLTLRQIVDACLSFRKACPHVTMWLEIFIIPGVNDSPESLARFCDIVKQLAPHKVQLNSLDRPGAVSWIQVPSRDRMEEIAARFRATGVETEIITRQGKTRVEPAGDAATYNNRILAALQESSGNADEIASRLQIDAAHITTHLRRMEKAGLVTGRETPCGIIYNKTEG
ncbi:MAG: radical SAM protein [Lentisphaeria bacterium]|nr:radical SAM protein [Lentisphaeria bacterium]